MWKYFYISAWVSLYQNQMVRKTTEKEEEEGQIDIQKERKIHHRSLFFVAKQNSVFWIMGNVNWKENKLKSTILWDTAPTSSKYNFKCILE